MATVRESVYSVALSKHLRTSTVNSYLRLLGPILEDSVPVSQDRLYRFLSNVSNPNTQRSTIIALRSVLCVSLPIPKAMPRKYELQSDDTYRLALMLSPHEARGLLMLYAGLRVGEACAVTGKDLNGRWLTVDKQVRPKRDGGGIGPAKTVGRVAVPSELIPVIQSLTTTAEPECVRESLRRAGKRLGFVLNPHQLRHACITRWVNAGMPLSMLTKQARHSDPAITLRVYAQVTNESVVDWMDTH